MTIEIIRNGHSRDLLHESDLSTRERAEFDYIEQGEAEYPRFFRYRRAIYDVEEFTVAPKSMSPFEGYSPDTYFSGVLIRFDKDYAAVFVGRYYVTDSEA